MSRTFTRESGTRHQRQMLREQFNGREGMTRAKRSDPGRSAAIAQSFAEAATNWDLPFLWELPAWTAEECSE